MQSNYHYRSVLQPFLRVAKIHPVFNKGMICKGKPNKEFNAWNGKMKTGLFSFQVGLKGQYSQYQDFNANQLHHGL